MGVREPRAEGVGLLEREGVLLLLALPLLEREARGEGLALRVAVGDLRLVAEAVSEREARLDAEEVGLAALVADLDLAPEALREPATVALPLADAEDLGVEEGEPEEEGETLGRGDALALGVGRGERE